MKSALRGIRSNPVLRRELLERWRGRRAVGVVTLYVAVLAAFTLLLAWIGIRYLENNARFGGGGITGSGPLLGRFLLENLLALTMGLAMLLAPAYAATQVSGERERRTLALLRITLVRPGQIVVGKLGASVAWLLLLILAAIPLTSIGFFLGGVTLPQLARGLFTVLAMTISVAALGIGISAMMKRSTPALVVTILTVGAITLGTLFAGIVEGAVRRFDFGPNGTPVTTLANPFVALADAVDAHQRNNFSGSDLGSILTAFGSLLPDENRNNGFIDEAAIMRGFEGDIDFGVGFEEAVPVPDFAPGGVFLDGPRIIELQDEVETTTPYWLLTSLVYLLLGLLALRIAAFRIAREDVS